MRRILLQHIRRSPEQKPGQAGPSPKNAIGKTLLRDGGKRLAGNRLFVGPIVRATSGVSAQHWPAAAATSAAMASRSSGASFATFSCTGTMASPGGERSKNEESLAQTMSSF
jgi:hypothetical protein